MLNNLITVKGKINRNLVTQYLSVNPSQGQIFTGEYNALQGTFHRKVNCASASKAKISGCLKNQVVVSRNKDVIQKTIEDANAEFNDWSHTRIETFTNACLALNNAAGLRFQNDEDQHCIDFAACLIVQYTFGTILNAPSKCDFSMYDLNIIDPDQVFGVNDGQSAFITCVMCIEHKYNEAWPIKDVSKTCLCYHVKTQHHQILSKAWLKK